MAIFTLVEPRVRQLVKPPVRQLVELLEVLDHQPLELHELVIRKPAEFLGQPVERREPELLVLLDTERLSWKKRKYGGTEKIDPQRTAVEPK